MWRVILPIHQDTKKLLEKNLSVDEPHRSRKNFIMQQYRALVFFGETRRDLKVLGENFLVEELFIALNLLFEAHYIHFQNR